MPARSVTRPGIPVNRGINPNGGQAPQTAPNAGEEVAANQLQNYKLHQQQIAQQQIGAGLGSHVSLSGGQPTYTTQTPYGNVSLVFPNGRPQITQGSTFSVPFSTTQNGYTSTGTTSYKYTVQGNQLVPQQTSQTGQISYNGTVVGNISNSGITPTNATITQPIYGTVNNNANTYLGSIAYAPAVSNGTLSLAYQSFSPTAVQIGGQTSYTAFTSYNPATGQVSAGPSSAQVKQLNTFSPTLSTPQSVAAYAGTLGLPTPLIGTGLYNKVLALGLQSGQIGTTSSYSVLGLAGNAPQTSIGPPTRMINGQPVSNPPPVILSILTGNPAYSSMNIGGYLTSSAASSSAAASSFFSTKIDLLNQSSIGSPTSITTPQSLSSGKGIIFAQPGKGLSLQSGAPKDVTVSSYSITTQKSKTVSQPTGFLSMLGSDLSLLSYFNVTTTESKAPPTGTANTLAQYIGGPHNNVFTSTPTTYTTVVKSNNPILSGYNSASSVTVPTTGFENVFHAQLYYQQQAGYAQAAATYGSTYTQPTTIKSLIAGSAAAAGTIGFGLYAPSATITQRLTAIGTVAVIALPVGEGIGAIAGGAVAGVVFTEGSSLISTGKLASGQSLVISAITAGAFVGAGELVSKFTPELYAAATGKTVYYRNTLADYVSKYGANAATKDFSKTLNTFGADTSKAYIFASRSGDIAPEGGLFYNAVNMGHMQASDIQAYLGRVQKTTGSNFRLATTSEGPLPNDLTVAGKTAGNEHFGGVRKYASGPQEGIYFNIPSLEGRAIHLNYNQNIMARAAGDVGSSNVKLKFTLNPFGPKGGLLSTGVDTSEISLASKARFTKETGIDVNTPEGKTAFSQWLGEKSIAQGKSFHYPYQNYFPGTDEAQVMANVDSKITSLASRTAVFKSDFSHSVILKLNTAGTGAEAEGTAGTGAVSGTGTDVSAFSSKKAVFKTGTLNSAKVKLAQASDEGATAEEAVAKLTPTEKQQTILTPDEKLQVFHYYNDIFSKYNKDIEPVLSKQAKSEAIKSAKIGAPTYKLQLIESFRQEFENKLLNTDKYNINDVDALHDRLQMLNSLFNKGDLNIDVLGGPTKGLSDLDKIRLKVGETAQKETVRPTGEPQVMANVDSKITSLASRKVVFKSDFSHSVILKLNTAGTGAEAEGTAGTGAVSGTGTAASYAVKGNLASAYSSASSLAGTKVVSLWSSSPGALASGILSSTSSSPIASSMVSGVGIDPAIISSEPSRQSQTRSISSAGVNSILTNSIGRSSSGLSVSNAMSSLGSISRGSSSSPFGFSSGGSLVSSNSGPRLSSGGGSTSTSNRSRSSGSGSLSSLLSPSNSGPSYSPPLQIVSSSIISRIAPSRKKPVKGPTPSIIRPSQNFGYVSDVSSSLLGIRGKKGTKAARKAVGLFRPLY